MKTIVTQGYHSSELFERVKQTWMSDDSLLVITPPLMKGSSFLELLPGGSRAQLFPEKPLFGVFTSGTVSGKPRLVLYSRKNIEAALESVLGLFDRANITSVFSYPQPFHTFGLTLGYLLALKLNVPLHFHEGKYSQSAHAKRASLTDPGLLTLGTPAHFYDLCQLIRKGLKVQPSYSCIMGGAPVDHALWQDVRDLAWIKAPSIGYGCTEASPAITHLAPGKEPRESGEIGFPLENLQSRMIAGEGLEISGPSLCLAIIQDGVIEFPEKLVISDNIEVRESDGAWIFRGRFDLLMNRGGSKIPLEQVENALKEALGITAIALAVPDARLGHELGLAIKNDDLTTNQLNEKISDVLFEKFQIRFSPDYFRIVDSFPLSASAKVDRARLVELIERST